MADGTRRSTRFSMRSKQLGQLLLENGDVQADQVAKALKVQEQQGGMIGQVLRGLKFCTEAAVAQALLKQVQVTDVQCAELVVPPEVGQLVPREACETEKLCPFERLGNLLCVVMGNPLNRRAITQIEERTHLKVKSFKSVWPKIQELIERTYSADAVAAAPEEQGEIAVAEMPNAAPPMQIMEPEPVPTEEPVPEAASPAVAEAPAPEPILEAKVEGIDNLNEAAAVVVETTRRGLAKRTQQPIAAPVKARAEKKAKVNVDLDKLDLSQGEVIKDSSIAEGLEEIAPAPNRPLSRHAGAIVALKPVRDSYFYAEGKAPGKRTEELEDLLESLPEAEVVAQSIGDYEEMQAAKPKPEKPVLKMDVAAALVSAPAPAALASRPIELQPTPAVVMAAVLISEGEFYKLAEGLSEDPVGEWDWKYAAAGPVPVQEYEEA